MFEDNSVLWWILAGAAILLELLSMSFYFLMLATVFAIVAICSYVIDSLLLQVLLAAVVGSLGLFLLYRYKKLKSGAADSNQLFSDVGATVEVVTWNQDQRVAEVYYRGSRWPAYPARTATRLIAGSYVVVAVKGPALIIDTQD